MSRPASKRYLVHSTRGPFLTERERHVGDREGFWAVGRGNLDPVLQLSRYVGGRDIAVRNQPVEGRKYVHGPSRNLAGTEEHQLTIVVVERVRHTVERQRRVRHTGPIGLAARPLVPDHDFNGPVVEPQVIGGIPRTGGREIL